MELVRIASGNGARWLSSTIQGIQEPRRVLHDERQLDGGFYTIQGRQIFVGGAPNSTDGQTLKITYYGEVPVFSDTTPSWVFTKFPSLYLSAATMYACLHAVGEEDKAAGAKQLTEDTIQKLNANHATSRASGSRITRDEDEGPSDEALPLRSGAPCLLPHSGFLKRRIRRRSCRRVDSVTLTAGTAAFPHHRHEWGDVLIRQRRHYDRHVCMWSSERCDRQRHDVEQRRADGDGTCRRWPSLYTRNSQQIIRGSSTLNLMLARRMAMRR